MNNRYIFDKEGHLHTLDGKPLLGTSTIVNVIAKPLTWWAAGLAVGTLGWTKAGDWKTLKTKAQKDADIERRISHTTPHFEKIKELSVQEYIALLDEAYKAHSKSLDKSASAGTDLHAELERYVKWHMNGKTEEIEFDKKIQPFIKWTNMNVKRFLWSEAHCYNEELWTGGISDCGAELNTGEYVIIDFKSSKEAYPTHFIQIGGYDLGISNSGLLTADGTLVSKLEKDISMYAVVPFGAEVIEPVFRLNVNELKEAFKAAVTLHKLINK